METMIELLGLLLNIIELCIVVRSAGLHVPLTFSVLYVELLINSVSLEIEVRRDK
ncbi:hypothetical protein SAMN00767673_1377 [Rubrobacter radiotolerans DSM 5868]|nr:hypothetical protein SAMN00767673_1377 [Rubrobacter radiotolerans DSM 5868]